MVRRFLIWEENVLFNGTIKHLQFGIMLLLTESYVLKNRHFLFEKEKAIFERPFDGKNLIKFCLNITIFIIKLI